ncbi:MAG TPA: hypothetical protein VHC01_06970 [Gaiellaceae bacterium]|nr:hypothetical protein [Gaiellaceae bacterium]
MPLAVATLTTLVAAGCGARHVTVARVAPVGDAPVLAVVCVNGRAMPVPRATRLPTLRPYLRSADPTPRSLAGGRLPNGKIVLRCVS